MYLDPSAYDSDSALCNSNLENSLFQASGWWGAGKKLGRRRKIDEGKYWAGKGFLAPAPVSPRFFPLVFLFALAGYDFCSPLSKRLEQATWRRVWRAPEDSRNRPFRNA